jgi:hypothetical protein
METANNPFFGRIGQMKATGQSQQSVKFELVVPLRSTEEPVACMSLTIVALILVPFGSCAMRPAAWRTPIVWRDPL